MRVPIAEHASTSRTQQKQLPPPRQLLIPAREPRPAALEPCEAIWLLGEGGTRALDDHVGSKVARAHGFRNLLARHNLAEETCIPGFTPFITD